MNLLAKLLHASWKMMALAVVAGMMSGAGSVGLIALVRMALAPDHDSASVLLWSFIALCCVVFLAKIASHVLLVRLWQSHVFELYAQLSRRIASAPLRDLERIGAPRLLGVLTEDIVTIANALLGLPTLCINATVVLCCLGYLAWLSSTVFFVVVGFLLVGIFSYQLLVGGALGRLRQAREQHDSLMKHFRGLTEGIKELKTHYRRREAFLAQVRSSAAALRQETTSGMTIYAVAGSWGQVLFFVALGLLLFALPPGLDLSTDILAGAALTILFTVAPLEGIMSWLPALGRARIALRNVDSLALSLADELEKLSPDPSSAVTPLTSVELAAVTHLYQRDEEEDGFLLGPIDMTLQPGEVVFLAGGNGSGKTTLAKLLTGLYVPEEGALLFNGVPVTDATREAYRQLFSVVFADFYLFNSFLGLEDCELENRARTYLALLELDHKVRIKDGTFSTLELSQGQRKRLALLIAYLEDRPVYVFDEWAADQDPRFKKVFYTRLLPELRARGKAILVISHDDRYFHVADRVIKLEGGRLHQGELHHEEVSLR